VGFGRESEELGVGDGIGGRLGDGAFSLAILYYFLGYVAYSGEVW
jgi:hypothetical protein